MAVFIDFHAIAALVVIVIASFFVHSKEGQKRHLFDQITSLSFYLGLLISLVWAAFFLSDITDLGSLGPRLSFSLMLLIYVTALRVVSVIVLRIKPVS